MIPWLLAALALLLIDLRPVTAGTLSTELTLWQGATLTPLVTPASDSADNLRLTSQFEILSNGQVIALTSSGELVDLSTRRRLPTKAPLGITSFTADARLLIVVRGRRLGWYDGGGVVEKLQLPQDGLTVVAGAKKRLYLYGPERDSFAVYLLEQGRAGKLFEVPDGRISTLTVIGERIFFAVGNTIYTAAEGQRPAVVFVAAAQPEIRSLAADPRSGLLYFSAGKTVYAMRAGMAISVLRGLEGTLRYNGNALYILDSARGTLVKLQGLEKLMEIGAEQQGTTVLPTQFKE